MMILLFSYFANLNYKIFEKLRFLKKFNNKIFFDFSRQCKYLQLEKLSSIGLETPIQKRLANNIL